MSKVHFPRSRCGDLARAVSVVLLACLIALPQAVSADNEGRNRERFRGGERSRIDPDQAASIVRQKSGGRVLGVRPGRDRHSVKVLSPDGRVYEIEVDPRTGDVR
ncbi:MAG: hypothetical protein H0T87_07355 [Gammaproteobacteria bacterium]|nr:hypothetical protein [Gammaproteobacteria bacterium]